MSNSSDIFSLIFYCQKLVDHFANIFGIDLEPSLDDCSNYIEMFFKKVCPVEEFVATNLQLSYKMWKEMRASMADSEKVLSVVKDIVERCLNSEVNTMDRYSETICKWTYTEIQNVWLHERTLQEELGFQNPNIQQLSDHIRPSITDLIAKKRMNILKEGSHFKRNSKTQRKVRDTLFMKLTPNEKSLIFLETDDIPNASENIFRNSRSKNIPLWKIENVYFGNDAYSAKETRTPRRNTVVPSISIITTDGDEDENLHLTIIEEHLYEFWTDGLRYMLGKPMESSLFEEELKILTNMEIQFRIMMLEPDFLTSSRNDDIPSLPDILPSFDN